MAHWHYCPNHPLVNEDTTDDDDIIWQEGPTAACPYHDKNRNRRPIKWGRKTRAKMDREAGVVGQDRGGYING